MGISLDNIKLAIIGLGYVGLPLAIEFASKRPVVGFDIDQHRIDQLREGHDHTLEVSDPVLKAADALTLSANVDDIKDCNVYIVTVPTPIDIHRQPDLTLLKNATEMLGALLKNNDLVIYESTVYPGTTEDVCVPILERVSGLGFNQDFYAGYSPERINPGDKKHHLTTITKVTSGSTPEIADLVDALYNEIIKAGTHRAASIKMAEAAKVIENTQRDVNIALVNELAMIFNRMDLDTEGVLKAAGSKWNFLPFRPGLVGGHCIGVDPYYLTHKAEAVGYHPQMILAGRRVNDGMGRYVAGQLIKAMINKHIAVGGARILILGLTYKEDSPDLRNTKVVDIIDELRDYDMQVDVLDPWVNAENTQKEYRIIPAAQVENSAYDAMVLAVAHRQFKQMGAKAIRKLGKPNHVLYDLKYVLNVDEADIRL